ncbi:hypothetical protein [Campylobacter sp. MIT 97-5078]|uniref:hypothetical protein n=1 Tax=Campylobacter sp. MIT 97-5078 TaxID=1548153 RepID=UPI00051352E1|nr:hypothetical protein [Campylobacter sp. MIT 97-5078]KGI55162.1 hypothetical protein LR59_13165 [Campylobacter sp. MIT 97-5078]KGI56798.1 hypothetical protein LR59_04755 [Campylobacter sp. MIT 97-5078]TQR27270.1 hypothetical protein DMB91_04535 [Campylobacter sp. MIT 97-5078]
MTRRRKEELRNYLVNEFLGMVEDKENIIYKGVAKTKEFKRFVIEKAGNENIPSLFEEEELKPLSVYDEAEFQRVYFEKRGLNNGDKVENCLLLKYEISPTFTIPNYA